MSDRSVFAVVIVPPATCTTLAPLATMLSTAVSSVPVSDIVAAGPTKTKSPGALKNEVSRSMTAPAVLVKFSRDKPGFPATFSTAPAKTTLLLPFTRLPANVRFAPSRTSKRLSGPSCCTVVNPKLCAAARICAGVNVG